MRIESNQKQLRIFVVGASALLLINLLAMWPHRPVRPALTSKSKAVTTTVQPNPAPAIKKSAALKPEANLAAAKNSPTTQTSKMMLVIKEWGVQLPLSSELKGLTYSLRGNEVRFTTHELESAGCTANSIGLPQGLVRSTTQIVTDLNSRDSLETSFRKINGQWYTLSGSSAMCFSSTPSAAGLAAYQKAAGVLEPALHQLQSL